MLWVFAVKVGFNFEFPWVRNWVKSKKVYGRLLGKGWSFWFSGCMQASELAKPVRQPVKVEKGGICGTFAVEKSR